MLYLVFFSFKNSFSKKITSMSINNWFCFYHMNSVLTCYTSDVYEEDESFSERNNNDSYRSTKSRSPEVYFSKGTKSDRKLSSGYFVCVDYIVMQLHSNLSSFSPETNFYNFFFLPFRFSSFYFYFKCFITVTWHQSFLHVIILILTQFVFDV